MADHYTYLSSFIPDPNQQKFVTALLLGTGLVFLGRKLTGRLTSSGAVEDAIVPDKRLNWFGFFDLFLETFVRFHDSVVGEENRRFVPFSASVFVFILFSNLLGLIPGMPAITTTVWINVALAFVVFFYFNFQGCKANGVIGYLKHFAGPFWWLAWFMFPLEIFSTCLRILTLNLRLYWNITADHMVLGIFTDLVPLLVPVIFYVLGTFICFIQAFIFTTLTMVYLLLAVQHEEEH